jgi:hypothetical protein
MGTLKLLVGFGVIVALIYGAWMVVPPFFANYEFEDELKNAAINATYSNKTEDEIQTMILERAHQYDIPLTKDHIRILRQGSGYSGSMAISCDYTVHVDLPGYPLDLHFTPSTQNKSVM